MNADQMFIGQRVKKIGGDYDFEGFVVAIFHKHNQDTVHRVVIENDDRILHIFSPYQLEPVE
jgi:hypothetical protein